MLSRSFSMLHHAENEGKLCHQDPPKSGPRCLWDSASPLPRLFNKKNKIKRLILVPTLPMCQRCGPKSSRTHGPIAVRN
jgi:hypothetical protein